MSRIASLPPFPVDIGGWMACFRYRIRNEEGHAYSPEQLGSALGVSGATVRRWESGSGRPRAQDIVNLARACRLSPTQLGFLNRALTASEIVVPPDPDLFRRTAERLLTTRFPAYLLDDLYHPRAWNSYVEFLPGRSDLLPRGQFLEVVLPGSQPRAPWRSALIRDFWLLTADRCGVPEYRRLLNRLAAIPGFQEEWTSLALGDEPEAALPVGSPVSLYYEDAGRFRVFCCQVMLPPVYYMREYIPVDADAESRLAALRSEPPRVHFADQVHWAAT